MGNPVKNWSGPAAVTLYHMAVRGISMAALTPLVVMTGKASCRYRGARRPA